MVLIMFRFFRGKPPFTSSEVAAGYIEAFANDNLKDPYAWDDFELAPEANPEVNLAIRLCWFIAGTFPARTNSEYMNPDGKVYFKRIAQLLRDGVLTEYKNLD
ncbi:hypothetical protein [Pontiella sp.]|uniref:hypothetical protein n=1 Tax=Pontiella sp. TaxID=2837462 RepID=UPI0035674DEA